MSAPVLEPPLGQGPALRSALRLARQRRLGHALVVAGPPGGGKTTVARWLAAALLCPSELDADGPCGACRTCRRVASGQHPDLHLLTVLDDKREIAVEQVRELQDTLQRLPVEATARAVVIDPADLLNEEGQNALLKTLEEPGRDTFVLLVTARPEALLPTVRSRAQRLQVVRLPDELVAQEFLARTGATGEPAARAVAAARGCLGRALESGTEQAVQLQELVAALCEHAQPLRAVGTARAVLAGSRNRLEAARAARTFLWLLRAQASQRMRHLAGAAPCPYRSAASEPWASVLELALLAERDLDLQIPPEQALAGLLLQWQQRLCAPGSG